LSAFLLFLLRGFVLNAAWQQGQRGFSIEKKIPQNEQSFCPVLYLRLFGTDSAF